jgi:hypothetical protein
VLRCGVEGNEGVVRRRLVHLESPKLMVFIMMSNGQSSAPLRRVARDARRSS